MKTIHIDDNSHKKIKLLAINKSVYANKYVSHTDILTEIIDYYFLYANPKMPYADYGKNINELKKDNHIEDL